MVQKFTNWLWQSGRKFRRGGAKSAARAQERRRTLEKRSLLSVVTVTLTVHVEEVGLTINGDTLNGVPVIGAAIQVQIWKGAGVAGTGTLVPTTPATPATDSNGNCTFKFDAEDGENLNAYAHAFRLSDGLRHNV